MFKLTSPGASALLFLCASSFLPQVAGQEVKFDSDVISGLGARNIGSAVTGGRVSAVAGVREKGRVTVYIGAADGGVWKSVNGGTTYKPVFDKQPVQSVGAIAIDPSASQTLWVGTGESWTRNSVSVGDGIYKSNDGGENWTNVGLKESERISKILVDPSDSKIVYACVPGKLWSDSNERGLYKTTDAGKTWTHILNGANASTGCSMIAMDAHAPKILYAGMWDFHRKGWTFRSGGESPTAPSGSAFFKTTDGGATWTELNASTAKGLPSKPWGRIAVAVAPSNSNVVYALIESTRSALFRSADGGRTWEERDRSQMMVWRPFYFGNLIVDPKDENKVFKPGGALIMSTDGGKSFSDVSSRGHGDYHDIWIDPANSNNVIAGDDGGVWYSEDGGNRWWKSNNLPIGQFYHVSVDSADPYHLFGGLQDNSVWMGDSEYPGGISNSRWENLYGGDGFWAFADPSDAAYVYVEAQGGEIARVNRLTHETRSIKPQPDYGEGKLRFNWNTPINMSPNDKGVLYIGSQFLFRSRDHGQTWDRISPDLTTNDPSKQKQEESGGVTVDNSVAEMHTTIYSISESPRNRQTIWVGTDDGNLQLTRDGGKSWINVIERIPSLPKFSWVSWVEASRFDEATAYAAVDRHAFGDMHPYVFKTTDFGKSWVPLLSKESGVRGYAHIIREDILSPQLLFVGTEFGVWVSIDGGAHWAQYKGGDFPDVAVRDIVVHPAKSDLILATHGRGIWIVDDIGPLRELTSEVLAKDAAFLKSGPVQQRIDASGGSAEGDAAFLGPNPPNAVWITYYQKKRHIFGRMKVEVLDRQGKLMDTVPAKSRRGISRLEWSMRLKAPRVPPAASVAFGASRGVRVLPGVYTVKMTRGKETFTTEVNLTLDERAKYTVEDRKLQFQAVMRAYDLLREMSFAVDRINGVHQALLDRSDRVKPDDGLRGRLQELASRADYIRKKIVATKEGGAVTGEERIREKAAQLYSALADYEGRPADYYLSRIDSLKRELADVTREFDAFAGKDLLNVNASLTAKRLKPINVLTLQQWNSTNAESEGGVGSGMQLNSLLPFAHAAAFSKAQR
jgi:photosystem II stability/assembly factor-like uncharacterized protein